MKILGGIGVFGFSLTGGMGVVGQSDTGVVGTSIAAMGTGVRGEAQGSDVGNTGVYGVARQGIGVQGFSANNIGVYASGGSSGLVATTTGSIAARFNGNVFIENGDLTVFGNKSAAVPHPDGSHRQLYVLESPESWFEDFGQALLQDGRADVNIDPEFAALIRADDYQVFLTPYGDCNGLYVSDRQSTGFTVRELQKGTSTLGFGYRVLARRKDVEAGRLERVELPELPTLPEPSEFVPPPRPHPLAEPDLPAQE